MTLFPDTPLELQHIQAMVRAMHELALADGMHDAERVMLRGFYESCQQDASALTSFEELIGAPFDVATAKEIFDTPERRAALLQSCVFLAYADGNYSAGERAKVKAIAEAVGADALELASSEGLVSDHLLQQISRISNVDALKQVSVELDRY
jgi:tellurite resistance protein